MQKCTHSTKNIQFQEPSETTLKCNKSNISIKVEDRYIWYLKVLSQLFDLKTRTEVFFGVVFLCRKSQVNKGKHRHIVIKVN